MPMMMAVTMTSRAPPVTTTPATTSSLETLQRVEHVRPPGTRSSQSCTTAWHPIFSIMYDRLAPDLLEHVRPPGTRSSQSCTTAWHPIFSNMYDRLAPDLLNHVRPPGTRSSRTCTTAWHPAQKTPERMRTPG